MAIVGRTKYTRARESPRRRDAIFGAPFASRLLEISRARVYFVRPTIAIAKIRDYSQSRGPEEHPPFLEGFSYPGTLDFRLFERTPSSTGVQGSSRLYRCFSKAGTRRSTRASFDFFYFCQENAFVAFYREPISRKPNKLCIF